MLLPPLWPLKSLANSVKALLSGPGIKLPKAYPLLRHAAAVRGIGAFSAIPTHLPSPLMLLPLLRLQQPQMLHTRSMRLQISIWAVLESPEWQYLPSLAFKTGSLTLERLTT